MQFVPWSGTLAPPFFATSPREGREDSAVITHATPRNKSLTQIIQARNSLISSCVRLRSMIGVSMNVVEGIKLKMVAGLMLYGDAGCDWLMLRWRGSTRADQGPTDEMSARHRFEKRKWPLNINGSLWKRDLTRFLEAFGRRNKTRVSMVGLAWP